MYACKEHIDYVMEDFIDKFAVAPTMEVMDSTDHKSCDWCSQPAAYFLTIEEETEESSFAD
ncbi:CxxH/CxxC protein [Shimazuella sp. AN120528]|uniref:CxxH/CxxC protein n=1 Tax=Shimazuella soli TaxID=1892854 RepID=UPI001F0F2C2C|nr:CxxH/CxxC protein [Shimazuella soli]MCH5585075.1 CxxH/CxxC protein [Shimazuella soli]